jgi:hypothetical protein
MNDFTREELMNLSDAILYCRLESRREKLLLIRDKIKSMIDNYCEHDVCAIDYDQQPLRCKKCLEIVE